MGLVASSQTGSASYSAHSKIRSRLLKSPPSNLSNPISSTTGIHHPHAATHPHSGNAMATEKISTKLKERRTWYHQLKRKMPVSERTAKKSALLVRSLIVGPTAAATPKVTKTTAKPQLAKIKSHLMDPKSANRIIAELRALPTTGDDVVTSDSVDLSAPNKHAPETVCPIHAVCLEHTDAEADQLYFSKLTEGGEMTLNLVSFADFSSTSMDKLTELVNGIHVVDLITSPDLGLGQPGDGPGVLAGAVPTPETIIKGIQQITPQLMALGFAVGKSIFPDHNGIFPPTDRMSVLTYWWGLELVLPPPSLAYLKNAQSVSGSVMNFLAALSLVNNGVREILPFVRYISQFVDFEFNQIKRQDHGKGVVCAATWIMPAALVPRPWDFPDPPIPSINPPKDEDELNGSPDTKPSPKPTLKPYPGGNGMPFLTPVPVTSVLDTAPMIDSAKA